MAKRARSGLRVLEDPFVVAPPTGAATKTRPRLTSDEDQFLARVGSFLGSEFRRDVAGLVRAGGRGKAAAWKDRKTDISSRTSSRWAGSITRESHAQYALGMRGLRAEQLSLRTRISAIRKRVNAPTTSSSKGAKPYRSEKERYGKTRRLAALTDRLSDVEARIAAGRPRLVFGGNRLWSHRENLATAGLFEREWREQWDAERMFFTAHGETGRRFGNDTIRVSADGTVTIYVPAALQSEIPSSMRIEGDPTHIRLASPVSFAHRGGEWADRVHANQAVAYTLSRDGKTGKWFLSASWTIPAVPQPGLETLRTFRTLAIDMNGNHFACWILNPDGNPVGKPATFELDLTNKTAGQRDALLRHTISQILRYAQDHGCLSISIEDLNFASESEGRESTRTNKRLRKIIAGMPTAQFRDRLVAMAHASSVYVIACDPAYTSRWAKEHWTTYLQERKKTPQVSVTGHHAAAVVIGRRAFGHRARRRINGPRSAQRSSTGQPVTTRDSVATSVQATPTARRTPASSAQETCSRPEPDDTKPVNAESRQPFTGHKTRPVANIPTLPTN